MAQTQIYYIATSKAKEIRSGGEVTSWDWSSVGSWANLKTPTGWAKAKKIKYNKTSKSAYGSASSWAAGGVTVCGTTIPKTATKTIDGVSRTVNVRYRTRGYTVYTRKSKTLYKREYTKYQYQLQYRDKPVVTKTYATYVNSMEYIHFADVYYDGDTEKKSPGKILHPQSVAVTYDDCRRNFDSSSNNSDGRDNKGTYVLSNVRGSIVTLDLSWSGLSSDEGSDLLETLNPTQDTTGTYPYITVQFLNPSTAKIETKVFYTGSRKVEKYSNGVFKTIAVTLKEV